jgi:hypothetical protein
MRVAVVQTRPVFGDVPGNLERAMSMAGSVRADLYVLPELCLSGYLFGSRDEARSLAQEPGDELFDGMAGLAASRGVAVVIGFAEKDGETLYNSSMLLAPDGRRVVYRKVQLFWGEKRIFEPGDRVPEVAEAVGARLGMIRLDIPGGRPHAGPRRGPDPVPPGQFGASVLPGSDGHQMPRESGLRGNGEPRRQGAASRPGPLVHRDVRGRGPGRQDTLSRERRPGGSARRGGGPVQGRRQGPDAGEPPLRGQAARPLQALIGPGGTCRL